MKRTAALGLVVAVFLIGLAGGMLGARLMQLRPPDREPQLGQPPFRNYFMQEDLRLSNEQRELLEAVFDRQRRKFELLHDELRPRVDALMEETQAEFEKILTPAQLEHFSARHRRWPRRPGRLGPPGRTPGPRHERPDPAAPVDSPSD